MNASRTTLSEKLWQRGRGIARACGWRHVGAVIPGRKRGLSRSVPVCFHHGDNVALRVRVMKTATCIRRGSIPACALLALLSTFLVGFFASTAHAQPVWQSSATAVGTAAAATVARPSGTVSDDLLVVGITFEKGSSETVTPPAGWTLIRRTNLANNAGMATYYKFAGASEPVSYGFGIQVGGKWAIGISRITGVNTSNPVDVSGAQTGGSSTSVTAPSVTTTVPNTLVLAFYTNRKAATFTAAAGTTERYDAPNKAGRVTGQSVYPGMEGRG